MVNDARLIVGPPCRVTAESLGQLQPDQQVTSSQDIANSLTRAMLVSLTVGKVDAGVAVLLTEDKRLVRPPIRHCSPAPQPHRRIPATHPHPYTG